MGKIFVNQLSKGQALESIFLVKEKVLAKPKRAALIFRSVSVTARLR